MIRDLEPYLSITCSAITRIKGKIAASPSTTARQNTAALYRVVNYLWKWPENIEVWAATYWCSLTGTAIDWTSIEINAQAWATPCAISSALRSRVQWSISHCFDILTKIKLSLTVMLHPPQLALFLEISTHFPEQQLGCLPGHRLLMHDVVQTPQWFTSLARLTHVPEQHAGCKAGHFLR